VGSEQSHVTMSFYAKPGIHAVTPLPGINTWIHSEVYSWERGRGEGTADQPATVLTPPRAVRQAHHIAVRQAHHIAVRQAHHIATAPPLPPVRWAPKHDVI